MNTSEIPKTKEGILLITKRPDDMGFPKYKTTRKEEGLKLKARIKNGVVVKAPPTIYPRRLSILQRFLRWVKKLIKI